MANRKIWCLVEIALFILFLPGYARSLDFSLHGFLQGNYSVNLDSSNPDGKDFKWAEEKLQLTVDASEEPFRLFVKTDTGYDHIDKKVNAELREGYLDYTAENWDLRVGRQVITWGLGDLVFITDVFPKDYEAFFSGRPLEYLKKGIDGAKLGLYPKSASLEIVAIPFFEPNNFPDPKRFWMYDPMPGVTVREEKEPENTEVALRLYRDIADFDASIYYYRGFFKQPSLMPDNPSQPTKLTLLYPELSVYGASLQGSALSGILSLEGGYYDSRQDRNGTGPMLPNSQVRFLMGYQRQPREDFTVGFQHYGEYMLDYSGYEKNLPAGFPKEKRFHQLTSLRLTQFLRHQTLRLSFFSFYSPSDGDYLLNPEIKYNVSDHIWVAISGNIFGGGEPYHQFGQLNKDDNLALQLRYEF